MKISTSFHSPVAPSGDYAAVTMKKIAALQKQLKDIGEQLVNESKNPTMTDAKAELNYINELMKEMAEIQYEITALQQSIIQKQATEALKAAAEQQAQQVEQQVQQVDQQATQPFQSKVVDGARVTAASRAGQAACASQVQAADPAPAKNPADLVGSLIDTRA